MKLVAMITGALLMLALAVFAAPNASAVTHTGSSLKAARKCWFSSTDYTWVQVILFSGDNGYYHRVGANYMGTYTFDSAGNRQKNSEDIKEMQVRQQNSTGSVNFGVGNNYFFSYRPTVGAYDESTSTSEYNWVHGSGLYIWTWLKDVNGRTCVVKYAVT